MPTDPVSTQVLRDLIQEPYSAEGDQGKLVNHNLRDAIALDIYLRKIDKSKERPASLIARTMTRIAPPGARDRGSSGLGRRLY